MQRTGRPADSSEFLLYLKKPPHDSGYVLHIIKCSVFGLCWLYNPPVKITEMKTVLFIAAQFNDFIMHTYMVLLSWTFKDHVI